MDEISFEDKMNHILDRIRELPGNELQEALDYLRLSVKYLVFDLEATRRENNYLRRIIEQSNRSRNKADEVQEKPQDEAGEEGRPDFGANGWE